MRPSFRTPRNSLPSGVVPYLFRCWRSSAASSGASWRPSIKVLNLLSVGGRGEVSRGDTNRVKVVLNPVGVGGAPFEVASAQDHRPDAREEDSDAPRLAR